MHLFAHRSGKTVLGCCLCLQSGGDQIPLRRVPPIRSSTVPRLAIEDLPVYRSPLLNASGGYSWVMDARMSTNSANDCDRGDYDEGAQQALRVGTDWSDGVETSLSSAL